VPFFLCPARLIEFAVNGFDRNLMQFGEFLNCKQSLQTTSSNKSTVNLIVIICVYKLDEFAKKKIKNVSVKNEQPNEDAGAYVASWLSKVFCAKQTNKRPKQIEQEPATRILLWQAKAEHKRNPARRKKE